MSASGPLSLLIQVHSIYISRAVWKSENPGVPVLFGGHNLPPSPPLDEIGLTDLPGWHPRYPQGRQAILLALRIFIPSYGPVDEWCRPITHLSAIHLPKITQLKKIFLFLFVFHISFAIIFFLNNCEVLNDKLQRIMFHFSLMIAYFTSL